jgi:hypothetical protein
MNWCSIGIAVLTASILFTIASPRAQDRWLYQSGPNGTPPFAYGDPYGNLYNQPNTSNWPPPVYQMPPMDLPTASRAPTWSSPSYEPPIYSPPTMPGYDR